MVWIRLLPWEYGIRNLFRRPLRSLLTLTGLTTVILMVLVLVGFVRGLEGMLEVSGDPQTALVFSLGMGENLEYSSIPMRTSDLIPASVAGIQERDGVQYVSPELYLGTQIHLAGASDLADQSGAGVATESFALVRGVTPGALRVRDQIQLESGSWPQPGQVMVGRLAATKVGASGTQLSVGNTLEMESREWTISGVFSAAGTAFESEIWCRLDDLQQAMKRQDLSLVAVRLAPDGDFVDLDLFCKERLDLELQSIVEPDYYAALHRDYAPIRWLVWLVVLLVAGAGLLAGLNTMYGAAVGRIPELSMLRTLGFVRRAIAISLVQEALVLALTASLLASLIGIMLFDGAAIKFTMGAFALQIDKVCVLIGCGTGLVLGLTGALPAAVRALRMPVVEGLKAV